MRSRWRRGRGGGFDIVWTGDVLLANAARCELERHGYDWAFRFVRPLLAGDYVIGNLEGPITERTERFFPAQRWSYNVAPQAAAALARAGFDAMSLSNNHCFDRGSDGLGDSVVHLEAAGIAAFGAGPDEEAAAAPLLIPTPHGTVGVIGIGQGWKYGQTAAAGVPGTIPLSVATIRHARTRARAGGARWVIAYVHWGKNYAPVTDEQRAYAQEFAAAGYDLVIGTGNHVCQHVEIIDRMPVAYSLGNFTFGAKGRFSQDAPGYGLVARTTFDSTGLSRFELAPIITDNQVVAYQPRPCRGDKARAALTRLAPVVTAHTQVCRARPWNLLARGTFLGSVTLAPTSRVRPGGRPDEDYARTTSGGF